VSALRRCRQPIPARVAADAHHRPLRVYTDRRGFAGGVVLSCAGPWRTSGAWWEDQMRDARTAESSSRHVRDSGDPVTRRHDVVPGFPAPDGVARDDDGFAWMGRERARFDERGRAPAPREEVDHDNTGLTPPNRDQRIRDVGLIPPPHEQPGREGGLVPPKREQPGREGGSWNRDEWDVALGDGAVYRIFRDRVTDGWFIDGVVD